MSIKLHAMLHDLSHTDFLARSEAILVAMIDHPLVSDPIPEPFPSLAKLKENTDNYRNLYHAALNGDRVKISQRNAVRTEAEEDFFSFANYLTRKAGKNTYLLLNTGYLIRERSAKSTNAGSSLVAPSNVTAKHGELPGVIIVRCSRVVGAGSCELQISEGDVSIEENWKTVNHFLHVSRMVVENLQPGRRYFFRARCLGPKGQGAWSAPVTLICL